LQDSRFSPGCFPALQDARSYSCASKRSLPKYLTVRSSTGCSTALGIGALSRLCSHAPKRLRPLGAPYEKTAIQQHRTQHRGTQLHWAKCPGRMIRYPSRSLAAWGRDIEDHESAAGKLMPLYRRSISRASPPVAFADRRKPRFRRCRCFENPHDYPAHARLRLHWAKYRIAQSEKKHTGKKPPGKVRYQGYTAPRGTTKSALARGFQIVGRFSFSAQGTAHRQPVFGHQAESPWARRQRGREKLVGDRNQVG